MPASPDRTPSHAVAPSHASAGPSSVHLTVTGVSHGYGDRLLLDGVHLVVADGERIAVVGENGAGKSTLLRLLAGVERPDAGSVAVHGRISRLAQTYDAGATVGALLAEASAAAAEDATAAERELEARVRAGIALERLGVGRIAREDADRTLGSLSGGEAERVCLALALADPAPILLLDEPTNHLDAATLAWLEAELAARSGIVVAVSHDRDFLERFARVVLEVDADRRAVRRYGTGYAGYLAAKAAERRAWEHEYAEWVAAKEHERAKAAAVSGRIAYGRMTDKDISGYNYFGQRVSAAVESQIRSARERLRRLEAAPVMPPPRPLHLAAAFEVEDGAALSAEAAAVPGRLAPVDLELAPGERLLVTGPNGAGKTTLLGVLAGRISHTGAVRTAVAGPGQAVLPEAEGGEAEPTSRRPAAVALLPQELPPPADPHARLLAAYAAGLAGDLDEHAERLLHVGLFRVQDFFVPVGSLSAGQYRRLALARLLAGHSELLLLDEPTNHLAPLLVGELEAALENYRGTLVVASHDRALGRWFAGLEGGRRLELTAAGDGPGTRPARPARP
ncbi:ATP-binding cassette domain-containing protein [Sinomonas mesophila]|uniref:ATP-binding cassette domain-containing protein n=1 Tax=Sinomonas mesophila TaxID=1531955 RepID=UPI00098791E8|nr:ATP-binding cassette domain-containing protein [Sinomonas mesophila]